MNYIKRCIKQKTDWMVTCVLRKISLTPRIRSESKCKIAFKNWNRPRSLMISVGKVPEFVSILKWFSSLHVLTTCFLSIDFIIICTSLLGPRSDVFPWNLPTKFLFWFLFPCTVQKINTELTLLQCCFVVYEKEHVTKCVYLHYYKFKIHIFKYGCVFSSQD